MKKRWMNIEKEIERGKEKNQMGNSRKDGGIGRRKRLR